MWRPAATQGRPLRPPVSWLLSQLSARSKGRGGWTGHQSSRPPSESLSLPFQARGGWQVKQMPTASPVGNPSSVTSDASN